MNPEICLEPVWHKEKLYIKVDGKLRGQAFTLINNWSGRTYSATHECYLILYDRDELNKLTRQLSGLVNVSLRGWSEDHEVLPHALTRAWINVPDIYCETLRTMRYSQTTIKNYVSQFKAFLSF